MRLPRRLLAGRLVAPAWSSLPPLASHPVAFLSRKTRTVRVALAASFAFAVLLAPVASAAKPGADGKTPQVAPLSLVSEYTSLNPYDPPWCLSEDDFHLRQWAGSLTGTFSATEQLRSAAVDYLNGIWWGAGGIGLQAEAYVVGTLSDITITSPLGVAHHGVLVGSSTSKGVTTDHYQVCYVPPFSVTSGTGGAALPGGTWLLSLSGNIARASYYVNAEMAYVTFQQQSCPSSEQNLTP